MAIPLFSYGSLQLGEVQRATFGRLLVGRPDALVGYRLAPLVISAPEVVAVSGSEIHMIARRSGDAADLIEGVVFLLSPEEIAAADCYEVDAYARIEVELRSGARAFAYVGPDD